jgi:hypothetical protein
MMKTRQWLLNTLTAAILVGLGACGGGGDGGPPPVTGPTIDITAANRDTVAHATVAGILALGPTGTMIPLAASPLGSGRLMSVLLQPLNRWVAGAWAQREQPQTVYGPYDYYAEFCPGGGRVREWDDDRDSSGGDAPTVGDVLTLVYENCKDNAGGTTNGTMTMTLTGVNVSPMPYGTADVTLSQMSYVTANHSMTMNGPMAFYLAFSTSTSLETTRMTASGPVTVAVSTHVGYTDTLTLQSGFVEEEVYYPALPGTRSTLNGLMESRTAGGVVQVSVAGAPLTKLDTDAYPSTGAMQVTGKNTTLLMTAKSAASVLLEHDDNGDGRIESTALKDWDWLL